MHPRIKIHYDKFCEQIKNLTPEEADFIEEVLRWPSEKRMAFVAAKISAEKERGTVNKSLLKKWKHEQRKLAQAHAQFHPAVSYQLRPSIPTIIPQNEVAPNEQRAQ